MTSPTAAKECGHIRFLGDIFIERNGFEYEKLKFFKTLKRLKIRLSDCAI